MFIVLTTKNSLEQNEKGNFLMPLSRGTEGIQAFYLPLYDTYEDAVEKYPHEIIFELPITIN